MTGLFPDEPQSAQDDTNAGYDFEQYSVWGLKMKSSMIMASVVLAAAAGAAQAGTVRSHYTPFQSGSGGEFRIVNLTGNSGFRGLASDITSSTPYAFANTASYVNADDFQTFCIERNETINDNSVYSFQISAGAIRGGYSGGNPDLIDVRTGWLYTQFRYGGLSSYSYNGGQIDLNPGPGVNNLWNSGSQEGRRERAARTLQTAIWFLEGELRDATNTPLTTLPAFAANLPGETNPNALTANEWAQMITWVNAATSATANGGFVNRVRALNLFVDSASGPNRNGRYDQGETLVQSQLTIIPLPTGAALGLAGLSVLAIRRRAAR